MTEGKTIIASPEDYGNVEVFESETGVTKHGSVLGREPEYVNEETFKKGEAINHGRVKTKDLSHKLDELAKDFYFVSLATVYMTIQARGSLDLIYQFGEHLDLGTVEDVVTYRAPTPIFTGLGDWDYVLQALPLRYESLFRTYVEQAVFPIYNTNPKQYWRIKCEKILMPTPGVISVPTPVDIFVPTGVQASFRVARKANGVYGFVKQAPEAWVVEEALRFFEKTGE